jgi:hypothetical protein
VVHRQRDRVAGGERDAAAPRIERAGLLDRPATRVLGCCLHAYDEAPVGPREQHVLTGHEGDQAVVGQDGAVIRNGAAHQQHRVPGVDEGALRHRDVAGHVGEVVHAGQEVGVGEVARSRHQAAHVDQRVAADVHTEQILDVYDAVGRERPVDLGRVPVAVLVERLTPGAGLVDVDRLAAVDVEATVPLDDGGLGPGGDQRERTGALDLQPAHPLDEARVRGGLDRREGIASPRDVGLAVGHVLTGGRSARHGHARRGQEEGRQHDPGGNPPPARAG